MLTLNQVSLIFFGGGGGVEQMFEPKTFFFTCCYSGVQYVAFSQFVAAALHELILFMFPLSNTDV